MSEGEWAMTTIKQINDKVTAYDLKTKSVYVQTTLGLNPLRLVGIGRKYLTVQKHNGDSQRINPASVTQVLV